MSLLSSSLWNAVGRSPFSVEYVDAAGVRTRVIRAGDPTKPTVVFLHGTGGHGEAFLRNLAAHSRDYHVLIPDLVGHGWTDKPAIDYDLADYAQHAIGLLDAFEAQSAIFSGESLGGDVAAWLATRSPSRVDAIVLNTGAGYLIPLDTAEHLADVSLAAVKDPSHARVRARLEWLFRNPDQVPDELVECRRAIYSQPDMASTMQRIFVRLTTPEGRGRNEVTAEEWRDWNKPALIVGTTHDPTAPPSKAAEIASYIPGAEVAVIEEAGHWPQFEKPDEFNSVHLAFLDAVTNRQERV